MKGILLLILGCIILGFVASINFDTTNFFGIFQTGMRQK